MKTTEHGIEDSKDVENIYHMRLMTLLQELVREKGYKGAARVLEIDQATVTESAKTGQLTRRVRQALERALQEGVGSAAERQRKRNEELEGQVGKAWRARSRAWLARSMTLGKEARRRLSAIEGEVAALRREGPQGTGAGHAGAGPSRAVVSAEVGSRCVGPGQETPVEAVDAAGAPRPGDAGAGPGRRGDIRRSVAADRRVAGAEGRAPQRRKGACVAGGPGAVAGGGTGAAWRSTG